VRQRTPDLILADRRFAGLADDTPRGPVPRYFFGGNWGKRYGAITGEGALRRKSRGCPPNSGTTGHWSSIAQTLNVKSVTSACGMLAE
jgi:hypothetical protein